MKFIQALVRPTTPGTPTNNSDNSHNKGAEREYGGTGHAKRNPLLYLQLLVIIRYLIPRCQTLIQM